ncbi:MAG: leucine-rich repeat domain-containing protein [Mycoplasma sp.]
MNFKKKVNWIYASVATTALLGGAAVGTYYAITTNIELDKNIVNEDYNKNQTWDSIIESLVDFKSDSNEMNKEALGEFINLSSFDEGTKFQYVKNRIDYVNANLELTFLAISSSDENSWTEHTVAIDCIIPSATKLSVNSGYDKNLNQYEVLNFLTNQKYTSTDKIESSKLAQYVNLDSFPSISEFQLVCHSIDFENDNLEITFTSSHNFNEQEQIINEQLPFSFTISSNILKQTNIIESSRYSESRDEDEIKDFLLIQNSASEINIANLRKYLFIDNIDESTIFSLNSMITNEQSAGVINVSISYKNYLDENGKIINKQRTFEFAIKTNKTYKSTNIIRNNNMVNSRTAMRTLKFLTDTQAGNDSDINTKNLSTWFELRNLPENTSITLNSNKKDSRIGLSLNFTLNKYFDNDGNLVQKTDAAYDDKIATYSGTIPYSFINSKSEQIKDQDHEKSLYDLKETLLHDVPALKDKNIIDPDKFSKYIKVTDLPPNSTIKLNEITKDDDVPEDEVSIKITYSIDKWYINDEIEPWTNKEFTIEAKQTFQTNIEAVDNYSRAITKEGWEKNLTEGETNIIDYKNNEIFNTYFKTKSIPEGATLTLVEIIDNNPTGVGGVDTLTVNLLLDKANDNNGKPLSNETFTLTFNYVDTFDFDLDKGIINGLSEDWKLTTKEFEIPAIYKGREVTEIANGAFANLTNLEMEELHIPDEIKKFGTGIFSGLKEENIGKVYVPLSWDDKSDGWKSGFEGKYVVRDRATTLSEEYNITNDSSLKSYLQDLTPEQIIAILKDQDDDDNKLFPEGVKITFSRKGNIENYSLSQEILVSYDIKWDVNGNTVSTTDEDSFILKHTFDVTDLFEVDDSGLINKLTAKYDATESRDEGNIIIPDYIGEIQVTGFADDLFQNKNVKNIYLENAKAFKKIGNATFKNVTSLVSISELSKIVTIGNEAFSGCTSFASDLKMDNIESIGKNAFDGCTSLKKLSFESNTKNNILIDEHAFKNCSALSFTLEFTDGKFQKLGTGAFSGVPNEGGTIIVPKDWDDIPSEWVEGYEGNYVVKGRSESKLSKPLVNASYDYSMDIDQWKDFLIPGGNIDLNSLHQILDSSELDTFPEGASFKMVEDFVAGVNEIKFTIQASSWYDVNGNTKTKDTTPSGGKFDLVAKHLVHDTFEFNTYTGIINGLVNKEYSGAITIPSEIFGCKVIQIGDGAFKGSKVQTITFSEGLEYIDKSAFEDVTNASFSKLPDTLKEIRENAFAGSSIASATLSNLEKIGSRAFYASQLTTLDFGTNSKLKTISIEAFADCNIIGDVKIPKSVDKISLGSFDLCVNIKILVDKNSTLWANVDTWCENAGLDRSQVGSY